MQEITESRDLVAVVAAQAERIATLERALGIRAPEDQVPVRQEDRGVTIYRPIGNPAFEMPSAQELGRLYEIVLSSYPRLRPRAWSGERQAKLDRDHRESFEQAFVALAEIGRTEHPDEKRALTYWIDQADEILAAHGRSRDSSAGFIAAALAHGDIPFSPIDGLYSLELGLAIVGSGRPASNAWRRVLSAGKIGEPFISTRERRAREMIGR